MSETVGAAEAAVESRFYEVSGVRVHCLEVNSHLADRPRCITVVLLHAEGLTAETWHESRTLAALDGIGVRAIAVDLPGHGVTGGRPLPEAVRGAFLHALLTVMCRPRAGSEAAASGKPPMLALVTPADSSSYALPYLASHARDLDAWVPVAADLRPWATRAVHLPPAVVADKLRCVAVFGDSDPRRSDLGALEEALPRVQMVLVPGAGRACYADNPAAWGRVLVRLVTEELQAGG